MLDDSIAELIHDWDPPGGDPPAFWGHRGRDPLKPPPGYGVLGVQSELQRLTLQALAGTRANEHRWPASTGIDVIWDQLDEKRRIRFWHRCEQLAFDASSRAMAPAVGARALVQTWNREFRASRDAHVRAHATAVGRDAAIVCFIRFHRLPQLAARYPVVRREVINTERRLALPHILGELKDVLVWASC